MTIKEKFEQFFSQFNNFSVEVVDPINRNQCFDLIIAWTDWLNIPRVFPHLYAYQIYTIWSGDKLKYFDRIENTPEVVPQKGDIIVWSKAYNGTAGHTGISAGEGDVNTFKAFAQNDPIGTPSVLKTYKYTNVLGWLRYKGNQSDALTECLKAHKTAVEAADKKDEEIKDLKEQIKNLKDAGDGQIIPNQMIANIDGSSRGECILMYATKRTTPSIALKTPGSWFWSVLTSGASFALTQNLQLYLGASTNNANVFAYCTPALAINSLVYLVSYTANEFIEISAEL